LVHSSRGPWCCWLSTLHYTRACGVMKRAGTLCRSRCALLSSTNADCLCSVGTLLYVMFGASLPKLVFLHACCLLSAGTTSRLTTPQVT
jgi:hypothetical protein